MTRSRGRGKRVVGGDRGEGGLVGEVGGAEKEMLSSLRSFLKSSKSTLPIIKVNL